jgi:hypothetical protein
MRDLGLAICLPLFASLVLYAILKPIFPSDAAGLATGSLALAPFVWQKIRRRNVRNKLQHTGTNIVAESELGPINAVALCSFSIIGVANLVSLITSFFVRSSVGGEISQLNVALAIAAANIAPTYLICFWSARWLILSRANKYALTIATTILVVFSANLAQFFLIPKEWFQLAAPWSSRTSEEFIKFIAYSTPTIGIPLALGVLWYRRQAVRLGVSAMMRLLPHDTQKEVAELIRQEVATRRWPIP